jgi:hypothetical protein
MSEQIETKVAEKALEESKTIIKETINNDGF